jgi:hypothetical protein
MLAGICRALGAQHRAAEMNKNELIALDDRGIATWNSHDVDGFATMSSTHLCIPTSCQRLVSKSRLMGLTSFALRMARSPNSMPHPNAAEMMMQLGAGLN